jgi:hypothetical protein
MIIPILKKDLATLANLADGKNTGATNVVEISYKDGTCTLAATDAYIVAEVVLPGHTPEEVQALPIDNTSNYLVAESLRKAIKQIPRSKTHIYVSIEGANVCELVTDQASYPVEMKGIHSPNMIAMYAHVRPDRLAHAEPNSYQVESTKLKKAVTVAHDLNRADFIQFKPIKRSGSPYLQWVSPRTDRGYAKVVMTAKYATSECE